MSCHKSDVKASMQQRAGTRDPIYKEKWICHSSGHSSGQKFAWLADADGTTPYCAAHFRPPWLRSGGDTACGCRRAYGQGEGFCNADTQGACARSLDCECGLDTALLPELKANQTRLEQVRRDSTIELGPRRSFPPHLPQSIDAQPIVSRRR